MDMKANSRVLPELAYYFVSQKDKGYFDGVCSEVLRTRWLDGDLRLSRFFWRSSCFNLPMVADCSIILAIPLILSTRRPMMARRQSADGFVSWYFQFSTVARLMPSSAASC